MRSVLLLGADPATVSAYRGQFERAGVTLASAEILEPLGDFIRLARPAAVLLDVSRAKTDGARLLREIRSQPDFETLPVFALAEKDAVNSPSLATSGNSARVFWKSATVNPDLIKAVTEALNGTSPEGAVNGMEKSSANHALAPGPALNSSPNHGVKSSEPLAVIKTLSEVFRAFCAVSDGDRSDSLNQMQELVRSLRRILLAADRAILTAFASALVRLMITLPKGGANASPSCLKTVSAAIAMLADALETEAQSDQVGKVPIRVLVLDDGMDSGRALQYALCSPELGVVMNQRADEALESLRTTHFDVVLADSRLLHGCDFPGQVQKLPNGKGIPFLLLTSLAESDPRNQSALNGGCELITAPFTFSEVVVKAFTLALKRRLGQPAPGRSQPSFPAQQVRESKHCNVEVLPASVAEDESPKPLSPSPVQKEVVPEPQVALNEAKAECERLRSEMSSLRDAERAAKNELQVSEKTIRETRELLAGTEGLLARQTSSREAFEQEQKRALERQNALEQKAAEVARAQDQSRAAFVAETEALKSKLEQVASEKHSLEAELSELKKTEPAGIPIQPAVDLPKTELKSDDLRHQLDEIAAFDRLTDELNQIRAQLLEERLKRQRVESATVELEEEKGELSRKLEIHSGRETALLQKMEALEMSMKESKFNLEKTEASLHAASGECRRLESKARDLEARLEHASSQASSQTIVEQSLRRRESELTSCMLKQQAELTQIQAALAESRLKLQRTRERVQASLSRVIQEFDQEEEQPRNGLPQFVQAHPGAGLTNGKPAPAGPILPGSNGSDYRERLNPPEQE